MIVPPLFPLDADKRAIGEFPSCRAIVDHVKGKPAMLIAQHFKAANVLTSGPLPDLQEADLPEFAPTDPDCVSRKPHGIRPGSGSPTMMMWAGGFNKKGAPTARWQAGAEGEKMSRGRTWTEDNVRRLRHWRTEKLAQNQLQGHWSALLPLSYTRHAT
jgi:hypothetical protein